MVKKRIKRKRVLNLIIYFMGFLLLMLIVNFIGKSLGITHYYWHLFLHIGIVIFSFLVLIYSLKLNKKAMKYIIIGSAMWIIINCLLFLGQVFKNYYWLETNLFTFLGMIIGCLLLMFGFKEAVND